MNVKRVLIGVLVAAVCAVVIVTVAHHEPKKPAQQSLDAVFADHQAGSTQRAAAAGVPASPRPTDTEMHTHVAVRILAQDGGLYQPPLGLGISDRGVQLSIHTHDQTGVAHMHQPAGSKPFTVGQLMAVWGVPVSDGALAGHPARLWVNGKQTPLTAVMALNDRDDLVIALDQPDLREDPLPAFDWDTIPLAD